MIDFRYHIVSIVAVFLALALGLFLGSTTLQSTVTDNLSKQAKHVTGQVYTVVGSKIAVWNQPTEVRAMWADGRWTPEEIAARLDDNIGQERMAMIDRLEQMRQAASSGEKPNA